MKNSEKKIKEIRAKRTRESDKKPAWVLKRFNDNVAFGWECQQYGERFTLDFVRETKRGFTFETYICSISSTIFIDRSQVVIVYELEDEDEN